MLKMDEQRVLLLPMLGLAHHKQERRGQSRQTKVLTCVRITSVMQSMYNEQVMSNFLLSRILPYPIKGCAGADVQETKMDQRGLRYDPRWMLVNELGLGLQQFNYPCLSRIRFSL